MPAAHRPELLQVLATIRRGTGLRRGTPPRSAAAQAAALLVLQAPTAAPPPCRRRSGRRAAADGSGRRRLPAVLAARVAVPLEPVLQLAPPEVAQPGALPPRQPSGWERQKRRTPAVLAQQGVGHSLPAASCASSAGAQAVAQAPPEPAVAALPVWGQPRREHRTSHRDRRQGLLQALRRPAQQRSELERQRRCLEPAAAFLLPPEVEEAAASRPRGLPLALAAASTEARETRRSPSSHQGPPPQAAAGCTAAHCPGTLQRPRGQLWVEVRAPPTIPSGRVSDPYQAA